MKRKLYLFFVGFAFVLGACTTNHREDMLMMADERSEFISEESSSMPESSANAIKEEKVNKKKIIRDGHLWIKSDNLKETKQEIDRLLTLYGAYYSKENLNNTDRETAYKLNIRVPSHNFDKLIFAIESGNGELVFKEIDARDVTEQFVDLETRLANKRNYLKRYKDLLSEAKTVKDILEIQEKIRALEEEMESAQGRLKYLSDLVAYSTLRLRITNEKDIRLATLKRAKFSSRFKHALSNGWLGFVDFFLILIRLWPFVLIASLLLYIVQRIRKKKSKKMKTN